MPALPNWYKPSIKSEKHSIGNAVSNFIYPSAVFLGMFFIVTQYPATVHTTSPEDTTDATSAPPAVKELAFTSRAFAAALFDRNKAPFKDVINETETIGIFLSYSIKILRFEFHKRTMYRLQKY